MARRRRPSTQTFSDQFSVCGKIWRMQEKSRRKEAKALTSKMISHVVFDIFAQISLCSQFSRHSYHETFFAAEEK